MCETTTVDASALLDAIGMSGADFQALTVTDLLAATDTYGDDRACELFRAAWNYVLPVAGMALPLAAGSLNPVGDRKLLDGWAWTQEYPCAAWMLDNYAEVLHLLRRPDWVGVSHTDRVNLVEAFHEQGKPLTGERVERIVDLQADLRPEMSRRGMKPLTVRRAVIYADYYGDVNVRLTALCDLSSAHKEAHLIDLHTLTEEGLPPAFAHAALLESYQGADGGVTEVRETWTMALSSGMPAALVTALFGVPEDTLSDDDLDACRAKVTPVESGQ